MRELHFQSFAEYIDMAEESPEYVRSRQGLSHNGGVTAKQAIELARKGWIEGTSHIRTISAQLVSRVYSLIEFPIIQFDVNGLDFDMGMHLSGTPECWYVFRNEIRDGSGFKSLRFVYNFGARVYVSAETMRARGYTAAALIILLEQSGFRVDIVAVNRVEINGKTAYDFRIPVKTVDQPLDIDRLTFIFAHPAMLRRLCFNIRNRYSSTMGASIDLEPSEQGDIYIDSATGYQWTDLDTAQAWIIEQLKQQGVHIQ